MTKIESILNLTSAIIAAQAVVTTANNDLMIAETNLLSETINNLILDSTGANMSLNVIFKSNCVTLQIPSTIQCLSNCANTEINFSYAAFEEFFNIVKAWYTDEIVT